MKELPSSLSLQMTCPKICSKTSSLEQTVIPLTDLISLAAAAGDRRDTVSSSHLTCIRHQAHMLPESFKFVLYED